jgi:hypothetical protein
MKKILLLALAFLSFCCQGQNTASHTHEPPPPRLDPSFGPFMRAMYVDCADDIIHDIANNHQLGLQANLENYIADNYISYIALFSLDHGNMLGDPFYEPLIKQFLIDLRILFPYLQIGVIGSGTTFFSQTQYLKASDYFDRMCFPNSQFRTVQELEDFINPPNPDARELLRSEMAKFFIRAAKMGMEDKVDVQGISNRCMHAFDVLYVELEYWRDDLYPTQADKEMAFADMISILDVMQNLKCNYTCINFIDAEFNPTANYNSSGWSQFDQVYNADLYIDRATIPSYIAPHNWSRSFDWKCHIYHQFADPSTKNLSKLFVQLSAESHAFNGCHGNPIAQDFLGDYLNGTGYPSGNMFTVEREFINKLDDPFYQCGNCACLTYDDNHYPSAVHPHQNIIVGSIWFTYSIMQGNHLSRLSGNTGFTGPAAGDKRRIEVEEDEIRVLNTHESNLKGLYLYNSMGQLLASSDNNRIEIPKQLPGFAILEIVCEEASEFRKLFLNGNCK